MRMRRKLAILNQSSNVYLNKETTAMSIVLAGIVTSTIERKVLSNDAQTRVSSFTLSFIVQTSKDTTRNAELQVQAYGQAADFDFAQGSAVIVEGTLLVNKVKQSDGTNRNFYSIDARRVHAGFEGLTLNSVSLVGRLGSDPDVKYFESGTVKADFSIASQRTKQITDWYSIGLWGKTAEVAANYVHKGGQVGINGSLVCEWWMDKNGNGERSKFTIKGDKLTLLGGKRDEESNSRELVGAGAASSRDSFDDIAF